MPRALDGTGLALALAFVFTGRLGMSVVGIELVCSLFYGFGLFAMAAIVTPNTRMAEMPVDAAFS